MTGRDDTAAPRPRSDRHAAPSWLLRQRVAIPAAPEHYCHRPQLARRCDPADSAVTALVAPGGFGKTTVLAAACRDAVADGLPVAWLTLDDDDPATLDTYLAFAFHHAGLDVQPPASADESTPDGAGPRTTALLHALDARDAACVLVLDELECVANPGSVELLNHLLRHAPPCLRLALACRRLPRGLDATGRLLSGGAELVTAADLRFSTPDIARFFDLSLSRRQLARVAADSGGWPIALQMHRNSTGGHADIGPVVRDAVDNWIDGRFWRGFAAEDQELVLDLALFDWLDADLVDDVLEEPGALDRATSLPGLAGLLRPAPGAASGIHQLHPLLREHCSAARRRDDPVRWRAMRRRLARALARRGAVVEAMRHAAGAADPDLAGRILVDAGGVQWWLAEGRDRLAAADRLLTDAAVAAHPRLAMARSLALLFQGRGPRRAASTRVRRAPPPSTIPTTPWTASSRASRLPSPAAGRWTKTKHKRWSTKAGASRRGPAPAGWPAAPSSSASPRIGRSAPTSLRGSPSPARRGTSSPAGPPT